MSNCQLKPSSIGHIVGTFGGPYNYRERERMPHHEWTEDSRHRVYKIMTVLDVV